MRESLEQTPRRIHTGKGGKRTEMTTRRMSDKHSQHMGGGLAGGGFARGVVKLRMYRWGL